MKSKFHGTNGAAGLGVVATWSILAIAALVTTGCDKSTPTSSAPAPAANKTAAPPAAPASPSTAPSEGTQPAAPAAPTNATDTPRSSDSYGVPNPLPRTPGGLRIATYNLENLFDDHDDRKYSGRNEDLDDAKPVDHVKALAATIKRIDADVIAVEEIESEEVLRAFRDTYLADMGYRYLVSIDSGDDRGIEQGVLSRYPLEKAQVWPDLPLGGVHPEKFGDQPNDFAGQPITYRRSPLRVDVVVPPEKTPSKDEYRVTLFVVHHKSGRGGGYWREAESKKAVELIAQAEAATPGDDNVIVLGDFNALSIDDSVKTYLDRGFVSADKLARASETVKARKWKAAAWTSHASGRAIDMILLNPGVANEFVPESMFILSTPQRPRGSDWRTTPPPTGYGSDHQPVVIDLIPRDN